jgi:hypothetical protein
VQLFSLVQAAARDLFKQICSLQKDHTDIAAPNVTCDVAMAAKIPVQDFAICATQCIANALVASKTWQATSVQPRKAAVMDEGMSWGEMPEPFSKRLVCNRDHASGKLSVPMAARHVQVLCITTLGACTCKQQTKSLC